MEFRKRCLESSPRKVSATTSANESSVLLLLVRLICKKRKDAEMHCFIDLVLLGAPLEVRTLTCYTNCNGLRTSLGRCSSHADTRSSPLCWSCCWACRTRTCTHVLPIHLNRFFFNGEIENASSAEPLTVTLESSDLDPPPAHLAGQAAGLGGR